MSDFEFSYEPRNSNGKFPDSFTVNIMVLGYDSRYTFFKIDGFAAQASLSSNVLIKNDLNSEISRLESENLVNNFCIVEIEFQFFFSKTYQIYFDDEKQYFATLINNTDLIDRGIDTKGYEYRIVKMFLNILKFL